MAADRHIQIYHHPGHSFPTHQVLILMEPYLLAAEIMPTSVFGSKIMSLPDRFQSATSALDPSGFNSVVFPGTNMFLHLGDGSTNT